MADSQSFEWLCDEIERRTPLTRIEARGTVRLVLKDAGLEPASVDTKQLAVVLARLMPDALQKRKVPDADVICRSLEAALRGFAAVRAPASDTAYDVFARLDGSPKGKP